MKPNRPSPIDPTRIRKMQGSFGWIPHDFIRLKITEALSSQEILLYLFLCVAADINGVSFYGSKLMEKHLKLDHYSLYQTRQSLAEKGLILYREGVYQVLPLTEAKVTEGPEQFRKALRKFIEGIDARSSTAK